MKKITVLTGAVMACSLSFAQIGKGSLMLGGSLDFATSASNATQFAGESRGSGFRFFPSVGYAIRKNLFLGVGGSYLNNSYKNAINTPSEREYKSQEWSANVFLRKYAPLGKNFYLFAEPSLYFQTRNTRSRFVPSSPFWDEDEFKSYGVALYPGVAYAVNRKLHLEVGMNRILDISVTTSKDQYMQTNGQPDISKSTGFRISTNANTSSPFTVGARILLAK